MAFELRAHSWLLLLAACSSVSAQSSTAMPASFPTTLSSSTTSSTGNGSTSTQTPDNFAQQLSTEYIAGGMKSAAVSYVLEEEFGSKPTSDTSQFHDIAIFNSLAHIYAPSEYLRAESEGQAQLLSEEAYLVTALPSDVRAEASSFYSVFYSLQGITSDSSDAAHIHSLADYYKSSNPPLTTSSTGAAPRTNGFVSGAALGVMMALLGML